MHDQLEATTAKRPVEISPVTLPGSGSRGKVEQGDGGSDAARLIRHARHCGEVGRLLQNHNELEAALKLHRKALNIRQAMLGEDHLDSASSHASIGFLLVALGNDPEGLVQKDEHSRAIHAEECHQDPSTRSQRRCLAITQAVLGKDHVDTATAHHSLGSALFATERWFDAMAEYRRALALRESKLGCDHPDLATSYNTVGMMLAKQRKYADALANCRKALAIRESKFGKDHPFTAESYGHVGYALLKQKKYVESLAAYRQCLVGLEKTNGEGHPSTAMCLFHIGTVLHNLGRACYPDRPVRYTEALAKYRCALAVQKVAIGSDHKDTKRTVRHLFLLKKRMKLFDEDDDSEAVTDADSGDIDAEDSAGGYTWKYDSCLNCVNCWDWCCLDCDPTHTPAGVDDGCCCSCVQTALCCNGLDIDDDVRDVPPCCFLWERDHWGEWRCSRQFLPLEDGRDKSADDATFGTRCYEQHFAPFGEQARFFRSGDSKFHSRDKDCAMCICCRVQICGRYLPLCEMWMESFCCGVLYALFCHDATVMAGPVQHKYDADRLHEPAELRSLFEISEHPSFGAVTRLPESPYASIVTTKPVDGASTASIPSLPDGWTAATDPEGRTFYLDSTTKTTHWALPGTVNAASTA